MKPFLYSSQSMTLKFSLKGSFSVSPLRGEMQEEIFFRMSRAYIHVAAEFHLPL